MTKPIPAFLLLLILLGEALGAASLLNYESRVVRAAEQIKRIKIDRAYSEEGISTIRKLLPRFEQVEIEGETVKLDHTWLYVLLDSYEAERNPQKRAAYLDEAAARLRDFDTLLRQSQDQQSDETISDETIDETATAGTREKIREILSRPEFQPRQESRIGAFIKKIGQSVADFFREAFAAFSRLLSGLFGSGSGGSWIVRIIVFGALLAALVAAVYRVQRAWPKKKRAKKRTVLGEEIEAGATPGELAESAMAAARRGDFRRAMRGLYIALLYELAERNIVELDDSATNHEYLARVSRFNSLAIPMRYLTERFDYFWYGMFPSTEADYSTYLARYKEAVEQVRSLSRQPARA